MQAKPTEDTQRVHGVWENVWLAAGPRQGGMDEMETREN